MAIWKQVLLSLVMIAVVAFGWYAFVPGAKEAIGKLGWNVQAATDDDAAGDERGTRAGGGRGRFGGGGATVVIRPAGTGTINDSLHSLGTGVALHSVTVTPAASGLLTDVPVNSGTRVSKGEVIGRLDDGAQRIAADKARLALSDAEATLSRFNQLRTANSATEAQVQQYQLAVDTAQLTYRDAELDLADRTIKAPISGTIGIVQVDAGNTVTSQTAIATIEDRSSLLVSFRAPERYFGQIASGDPLTAVPVARPGEQVSGTVVAIDNKVDPASGTFEVRGRVPNPGDDLVAGMTFNVSMTFAGDSFVSVSPLSVQWSSDGAYVWRVADGKVEKAMVSIIQRNTDAVLVAGDIAREDAIVTEGLDGLREGAAVRIEGQTAEQNDQSREGLPRGERRGAAAGPASSGS